MNFYLLAVTATLWSLVAALPMPESTSTLEMVHMIFRHGNRNPEIQSLWKSNRFYNESYYPEGYGQLINAGKVTEFELGEQLRERYDPFLGEIWNINYLDVRTTDVNRTKMSVELMLAGLWPPEESQIWFNFFFWQPIPYWYLPQSQDKETYPFGACSKYDSELEKVIASAEVTEYLRRYDELFEILSNNTGIDVGIKEAFTFYFGIQIQKELGFPLDEWTKAIFPEPLTSAAVDFYYIETNNTALRRIMAGYFLRKVLSDTAAKINGSISPPDRKMFIYSAHETNIASLLLSLDAFKITETPPYGACVLIEVHKIEGVYGLKLFYKNYENSQPLPVKLPGCDYFCPYEEFYKLVEELLPETDADCNGS